jgi:hypothetical protein
MAEHTLSVARAWQGAVEPYIVGNPGRAASRTVPLPDETHWDRHDTVLDGVTLQEDHCPLGELRAVSIRGLAHRHYGRVRQDEYSYRRTPDGRYLVMCVADGVSIGKHSHHAAMAATRRGTGKLVAYLRDGAPADLNWPAFIGSVSDQIVRSGQKYLTSRGITDGAELTHREVANHLATTVLYAVLDLHADQGAHRVDLCAVGDTSAWVLRSNQEWEPLQPVKNEGATLYSSSVSALPASSPAQAVPMRTLVHPGEALVLMSDGVGDALGAGTGEVGRFLADVWQLPPSPLAFAAQTEFARKSFDDDRTVIAFWPTSQA